MVELSQEKMKELYNKYLELICLEVIEFGVRPTEVRHLIGRLGEFHCALEVNGTLAQQVNQHGFDVKCSKGRRISVKTTAQITGFVSISKSTLDKADDLMVVQYRDRCLTTVYYGSMEAAKTKFRPYLRSYELDITKARRLMLDLPAPVLMPAPMQNSIHIQVG